MNLVMLSHERGAVPLKRCPWQPLGEDISRLELSCDLVHLHCRCIARGQLANAVDPCVNVLRPVPREIGPQSGAWIDRR